MANPKKGLDEYTKLMKQKFDLEDRMARIGNLKWKLNNENVQCGQQLKLVEDQVRLMFNRMRVENEEDKSS